MSWFKQRREAGTVPASFLLGVVMLVAGCGSEVPSEEVTAGLTLDCQVFQATVNQIFDANINGTTCSASGCHAAPTATSVGGSGGAFKIYPNAQPNTVEMQANYYSAKAFANLSSTADSKLLLEPLAGAQSIVGSHAGGDIFASAADANYLVIYAWINNRIQGPSSCYP